MNPENKDLRNSEPIHSENQPAVSSGTNADAAGHARVSRTDAGLPRGLSRPLFVISGVALCMGLASCVAPYDTYGDSSVSVTRYSPGYTVNSLPGGYRSETISGTTYYYHDGQYYRPGSSGYVVVEAPRSSRYYDDYSRRYQTQQTTRTYRGASNRYGQQYDRGEYITRLPDGYREVSHRGDTYYQAGDQYYRRQGDRYVISTSPF